MPKTRNAFALRDFKLKEFLKKKCPKMKPAPKEYLSDRNFHFKRSQHDIKHFHDCQSFLIDVQKRFIRHHDRLEKYQMILIKNLSAATDEEEVRLIREKSCRVLDLSDKYTTVINELTREKKEIKEFTSYLEKTQIKIVLNDFAERLKEVREEANLTQTQLAEKLGTTQKIISFYETSRSVPSIQSLIALSLAFERSIDWLLGLTD